MKYNYIDLFSGAGGMSLGFDLEGFKNVFSVEYDRQTAQTYRYNFPNHVLINKDIQEISTNEIKKIINNNTVDVIIGGPPCQGFSLAGKFGRTFIDDPRNQLFKEYLRFVSILKPKIFIIENVARLVSHNKGKTIREIQDSIKKLGYQVKYEILQTSDYNIPQKRQRVFIVGYKNIEFNYPEKLKRKVTIKEAISDLPPLNSGEKSKIPNHFAMKHSQEMLYKMSFISDGGNRLQIPEEIRPKSGDARKYIKYKSDEPSIPVTGDMRKVFHYSQNRALTSRELARIQTFPDDFIFKGTSINVQQQIGNAVPPKLAKLIAYQVNLALSEGR
ncbi:DNA (cytosine-5-)-methyltransferase [Staphylococcus epidermidis]|uniref:DNA cytosine methyltransferase n=1 Tax=Staphylococcus TaxID=1279 RepID=UPI00024E482C|nr:DNA (cytosine-5-)-methyltransferase [Staphylococcus epidermidis]EHR95553.1 DNA (cytosine-5-)-methyltransferase [Staphylococcus epidermidis VCU127]MDH9737772.1 DNA (cytosine-5-)-methyltransferase [Staphylococcus epidermidis]MDH9753936.1 DNA (cytosine-5-)-methyltransferase [Staphylococcus epidermidis]MDH9765728.1 DNA (cytosine-5-)-methyltransferase [Staphylococcus epidermidis]MDH9816954.1 DNA (cytosine-5-)-methyltransferase [Staphylococcus epidermidis]